MIFCSLLFLLLFLFFSLLFEPFVETDDDVDIEDVDDDDDDAVVRLGQILVALVDEILKLK